MSNKCEQCSHWEAKDGLHQTGECTRFPPIFVPTIGDSPAKSYNWHFPVTNSYHRCGEFKHHN